MYNVRFLLLLLICGCHGEYCDNLGTLLYDDIGCEPILDCSGCPLFYNCNKYLPKEVCIFKQKTYLNGSIIEGTNTCNVMCTCLIDNDSPKVRCLSSHTFCPLFSIPKGCYAMRDLKYCCSHDQIQCPPFDKLATCLVNDHTYKEGEYFRPKGTCLDCVCQKGFSVKFVKPYCKRQQCDVELQNFKDIAESCAPIYGAEEALCCPMTFICQETSQMINVVKTKQFKGAQCKFGSNLFDVNDSLDLVGNPIGKANCSCILPPLLTCTIM